jgi:hypothetical protein
MISKWEANWTDAHNDRLLAKPTGNERTVVEELFLKWNPIATEIYK